MQELADYIKNLKVKILKEMVAEHEATHGVDHVETLRAVGMLGSHLRVQGRSRTPTLHRRTLDGLEKNLLLDAITPKRSRGSTTTPCCCAIWGGVATLSPIIVALSKEWIGLSDASTRKRS